MSWGKFAMAVREKVATATRDGLMSAADKSKLDGIDAGLDLRALYIGVVNAGASSTTAHGWGGRPTLIMGWANYDGNGTYYAPFSAAPDNLATLHINYCDNTNVTVRNGSGTGAYCFVVGLFPRVQS